MPSTRARLTVTLAVVALAVVAAVPANAVPANAVDALTAETAPTTETDPPTDHGTDADGSASANVTIRSGVGVEWADLRSRAAVRTAIADGTLSRARTVAVGDPLVVSIRHAGLADHLARGNATERFFETFGTRAANLSVVQTNPTPERPAGWLRYPRNATRVVADPAADVTHVVVATTHAPVLRDEGEPDPERVDHPGGFQFVADLTVSAESNLTDDGGIAARSDEFALKVRRASFAVDDETSRVAYATPAPNQTVRGETNVRPGLNVTVVARGRDDPATGANESFVRTATVPVRESPDGADDAARFAAAFDLSDVPGNATARLDVRYDGRSILGENASLAVVSPSADLRVRAVEPNATGTYTRVRAAADLTRGGFVALHRGSADGPVVGSSGFLAPGSHSNVTIYVGDRVEESGRLVAVAHRDANYNRWFDGPARDPAYANGTAAVETDHVLRPASTRRVTRTTTPTLTTTRTATPTLTTTRTPTTATTRTPTAETTTEPPTAGAGSSPTTRTSNPSTDAPIPGFGVTAAVLALLAVGVRAARQRE